MTATHAPFDACPDCHTQDRNDLYPWIREGVWCLNPYHVGAWPCLCGQTYSTRIQRWFHRLVQGPVS